MAQIKLNIIQIVHMPHYEKLLIQIVNMAHICENDMIQIKDMFQIVATWLQLSTEEYACYHESVEKPAGIGCRAISSYRSDVPKK